MESGGREFKRKTKNVLSECLAGGFFFAGKSLYTCYTYSLSMDTRGTFAPQDLFALIVIIFGAVGFLIWGLGMSRTTHHRQAVLEHP